MLRNECQSFFNTHLTTKRRYSFVYDDVLHIMDSDFIVAELIDSSEDELKTIIPMIQTLEPTQENIHHFLHHFATIYAIGNGIVSNE
jgi:hypothetical protein